METSCGGHCCGFSDTWSIVQCHFGGVDFCKSIVIQSIVEGSNVAETIFAGSIFAEFIVVKSIVAGSIVEDSIVSGSIFVE